MEAVKRLDRFNLICSITWDDLKTGQHIVSLAEQEIFVTSWDITNQLKRKRVKFNERTMRRHLNKAEAKYKRSVSKPLVTESHRENRSKSAQDHKLRTRTKWSFVTWPLFGWIPLKNWFRTYLEKGISYELSSILSRSMFEVSSRVKIFLASSVLIRAEMRN